MKPITKIILKFSVFLFLALVLAFYIIPEITEFVFNVPIRLNGLLIFCLALPMLIFIQKQVLKSKPTTNISELTLISTLIVFIAESIFQVIRVFGFDNNRLLYYLSGVAGTVTFFGFISFLIALQIKTRRTNIVVILSIVFMLAIRFLLPLFPVLN